MHTYRLANPPQQVISKYLIATWRRRDNIWHTSVAGRGGSSGFSIKIAFYYQTEDYEQILNGYNLFNYGTAYKTKYIYNSTLIENSS